MTRRIVIERLELDLRGIGPATAQAAARLLGPALSRALRQRDFTARSTERLDAGRIDAPSSPTAPQPAALAAHIAGQIARQVSTPRAARKATP